MSYAFKAGDKGKTRGGDEYECVYVAGSQRYIDDGLPVIVFSGNRLSKRAADGAYSKYITNSAEDLIPPPSTVYVNFYDSGEAYHYDTEDKARTSAGEEGVLAIAVKVGLPNS